MKRITERFSPGHRILLAVLALSCFGLVMVYSSSAVLAIAAGLSSAHYFESQFVKLLFGLVLLACFAIPDYQWLRRKQIAWCALALGLISLTMLLLHICVAGGVRAPRWISIGGFTLQPSEFARVGLVVFLAYYLSHKEGILSARKRFLVAGAAAVVLAGLVALQPNLSMAALILLLSVGILYVAGIPLRWLGIAAIPAAVALPFVVRPYQIERVFGFLGIGGRETAYQVLQSITAVGSGGLIGLGIGNGLQKYFFLPFPHTDFILGIVGEETGLLGITLLLAVYALLVVAGIAAARRARDRFGSLLAAGLTWNLAMNVLVHGAVNLGMGPVTGVPLPFLSCGGSSLMANLLGIGILLSVARHSVRGVSRDWASYRSA